MNSPLKLRIDNKFESMGELLKSWYHILSISNHLKLTKFEIALLVEIKIKGDGHLSAKLKQDIVSSLKTSIASINNSISHLKSIGLITKDDELIGELNQNFTDPTLILIKYGIITEVSSPNLD